MTKIEALALIDNYKNKLINPIEMLDWTWLRVIINNIPDDDWNRYLELAVKTLSK